MELLQIVENKQISSKKYLAVDAEEQAKLIKENQELKRQLEGMEYWDLTTAASLIKGHNNTWVVNNILDVPRFRKVLEDRMACIIKSTIK